MTNPIFLANSYIIYPACRVPCALYITPRGSIVAEVTGAAEPYAVPELKVEMPRRKSRSAYRSARRCWRNRSSIPNAEQGD